VRGGLADEVAFSSVFTSVAGALGLDAGGGKGGKGGAGGGTLGEVVKRAPLGLGPLVLGAKPAPSR